MEIQIVKPIQKEKADYESIVDLYKMIDEEDHCSSGYYSSFKHLFYD